MFKWLNNKKKENKGFTLVELVIVVAILAILVGLLAPQYTKYVERSRKSADASNVDNIVSGIKIAAADQEYDILAGTYTIALTDTACTVTVAGTTGGLGDIEDALNEYIGAGAFTTSGTVLTAANIELKSAKWGGTPTVTVTVENNGAVSVGTYTPDLFATYMREGKETD